MAVNSTYSLYVQGFVGYVQHIHTLHFRSNTLDGTAQDLITDWRANAEAAYRACFHNSQQPVQLIRAAEICGTVPLPAPVENAVTGAAANGTRTTTGDGHPSFIACHVAEKGALAGKSRQGRFFLGGLFESDTTYNDLNAPYLAAVQGYIDALMANYVTPAIADWHLVVHSRKLADVPGTACNVSSSRVANLIASVKVTTMRSRKEGHGL